MRNLKTADLFTMSRILKKMNLKKDFEGLSRDVSGLTDAEKKKAEHQFQIDLTMLLVENLGSAEQEIYKFLADLSGKTPKEIEEQTPGETIGMIKELFKQDAFGSFLSTAAGSTK